MAEEKKPAPVGLKPQVVAMPQQPEQPEPRPASGREPEVIVPQAPKNPHQPNLTLVEALARRICIANGHDPDKVTFTKEMWRTYEEIAFDLITAQNFFRELEGLGPIDF